MLAPKGCDGFAGENDRKDFAGLLTMKGCVTRIQGENETVFMEHRLAVDFDCEHCFPLCCLIPLILKYTTGIPVVK